MTSKPGRSYEKRFDVAAPVEGVWKAITDGEELTRWFCLEASCEPGVGGKQHVDWGGGAKGSHVITAWEPNAHLRTESLRPDLSRVEGAEPYAVDWFLETDGETTRVRMVASGFGEGPEWDYEYEGTFHGWDMFHKTLRHYLEHHRGSASANAVVYATIPPPAAEAWDRLMGPDGLGLQGRIEDLAIGAPFRFITSRGDELAGVVRNVVPGKTFSAMVESLNKAMLNIELASSPGHGDFLYLSLTTWGVPRPEVDTLRGRLNEIVLGLFPQQSAEPVPGCAATS